MVKGFKKKNSKGGHDFIPTEKKTTRNAGDVDVEVDVDVKELDDFANDKRVESEKHSFPDWQEIGLKIKKRDKINSNPNSFIVNGSQQENIKLLKEYGGFENITPDGYFSGSFYLDDGEGRSGYAVYHGRVEDGRFIVSMNKSDIPRQWREQRDTLLDDAIAKINDALD